MKRLTRLSLLYFLSAFIFAVGFVSFLSHITGHSDYANWNHTVQMALNTSLCFIAIGAGLFLIARSYAEPQ